MDMTETTVNTKYVFNGRIINVKTDEIILPDGKPASREVVEHAGGVCVAALTNDGDVLMVKQFRYPLKTELLELPAGKLNRGEDPSECGKRELLEETGAIAGEYVSLGMIYPSPGFCDEIIYMFLAKDLTFTDSCPDEDEFLTVHKIPLETTVRMISDGEITDSKTIAALFKVYLLEKGMSKN